MPDYIYLLENRLTLDQQNALRQISQVAREAGMTVFLVGGAVRDLTSGSSVRDLDVAVQGSALKLKKPLVKMGATLWGEHEASHTLFFRFPKSVRVEISSTRREEFPKPGKPVYHWDNILADLRRRDFTANAMALSLNERSYGLLMDPLNGVADIEARLLRLVSNYGFIEDPARLLRATRLAARLGWDLDEPTRIRFQNAKEQGAIDALSSYQKGYELEEIGHEEDALRILTAMENEGWMHHLYPAWTVSKADVNGLAEMHRLLRQLQMQGVNPDPSTVSMQLLTAKLQPKDLAGLKKLFVRPGFVEAWDRLDSTAKEFSKQLTGKEAATPSATWKLFTSANPQAVLWLGLTSKATAVQAKYKNFFTVWPEARQKIPYALMLELRIAPDIAGYAEMLSQLFFQTIDGKLETEEQLRAFLEPYSPPAPPPPVTVRRTRAPRKAVAVKAKSSTEDATVEGEPGAQEADVEAVATPAAKTPAKAKKAKSEAKEETATSHASAANVEQPGAKPISAQPAKRIQTVKQAKTAHDLAPASKPAKSGTRPGAKLGKDGHVAKAASKPPAAKTSAPAKGNSTKAASRPSAKTTTKAEDKRSHAGVQAPRPKAHSTHPKAQKKPAVTKPSQAKNAKTAKKR